MNTNVVGGARYEFRLPNSDIWFQVETAGEEAVVRVTRDVINETQKAALVRHLQQEGFISEESTMDPASIKWQVDGQWLRSSESYARAARIAATRYMFTITAIWSLLIGAKVLLS